ncbi:unnamed protein product, partial [marine sediment metagenome]
RVLAAQDFNDDRKDAGEIGSGHTVTALYEIVPAGVNYPRGVDPLKYQPQPPVEEPPPLTSNETMTVKVRYKAPEGDVSTRFDVPVADEGGEFAQATDDFRWASAVAGFGMLLRNSQYSGSLTFEQLLETANATAKPDPKGYRAEFVSLVVTAKSLRGQ